jgi:hypothetical protein
MELLQLAAVRRDLQRLAFQLFRTRCQRPLAPSERALAVCELASSPLKRGLAHRKVCGCCVYRRLARPIAPHAEDAPACAFGIASAPVDLRPGAFHLRLACGNLRRAFAQRALQLVELGKVMRTLLRAPFRELAREAQHVLAIGGLVRLPRVPFPRVAHLCGM